MRSSILVQALALGLCYFLLPINLQAQPMSGTYTIGNGGGDYASFTDAVTALTTNGINGAVVFEVMDGIYTEQVRIPEIAGASASNTITFRSQSQDSTLVSLTYPSSPLTDFNYTLLLDSADHVTFQYMTLQRSGTEANGRVVVFQNGAHYNQLLNNRIWGAQTSTSTTATSNIYSFETTDHGITIKNNDIKYGVHGIYMRALDNARPKYTVIEGNTVTEFTYNGIHLFYHSKPTVDKNTVTSKAIPFTWSRAIYLNSCDSMISISKNKVHTSGTQYNRGIDLVACEATSLNPCKVFNNWISQEAGTDVARGIEIYDCTYLSVMFNSVHLTGGDPTTSAALYLTKFQVAFGHHTIKNNIFSNMGGGFGIQISTDAFASYVDACDFNSVSSNGNYEFKYRFDEYGTVSGWTTASNLDANSNTFWPVFESLTNLRVTNDWLYDIGTPIPEVTDDIDDQPRDPATPDLGADEHFEVITNAPTDTFQCGGSNISITYNLSGNYNAGNVFTAYISDSSGSFANKTSIGSIASQTPQAINATIPNGLDDGTGYLIRVEASDPMVIGNPIDKVMTIFAVPSQPVITPNGPTTFCDDSEVVLSAPSGYNNYDWSSGQSSDSIVVNASGNYNVTVYNHANCMSQASSDVAVTVNPTYDINNLATICQGDSIFLEGAWQKTTGFYVDMLMTAAGCDSIINTSLSVNQAINTQTTTILCDGDSIFLGGVWRKTAGIYTDMLTASGGCDSIVETTVNVALPYNINDNRSICQGDSLFLSGSWQTTAGIYVDQFTSKDGCDSVITTTLQVDAVPATPAASADRTYCSGDAIADVSVLGGNGTFTWYDDAALTNFLGIGATFTPFNQLGATTYYVTETTGNCASDPDSVKVTIDNCSGIATGDWQEWDVHLYPNPTAGMCWLQINGPNTSQTAHLKVWQVTGEMVFQKAVQVTGTGSIHLDLTEQAAGMYFAELTVADQKMVMKLIRE